MSGFDNTKTVDLLFKKFTGVPSTLDTRRFYEEPPRNARQEILPSQIWIDNIAIPAPSELSSLTSSSLDDNGNALAGSLVGRTSSDGILRRFIQVPMTMVIGSLGSAYEIATSTVSHPMNNAGGTPGSGHGSTGTYAGVGQNMVPFNVDPGGSYLISLFRHDATEISFGYGQWLIDNSPGIVTFYDYPSIASEVTEALPPLFSFYKYIGRIGFDTLGASLGTTIFNTGVSGGASIQVSSLDPGSINTLTDSLQFGGNFNGAMRLNLLGGNGDPNKTKLCIQKLKSGSWVTINEFR